MNDNEKEERDLYVYETIVRVTEEYQTTIKSKKALTKDDLDEIAEDLRIHDQLLFSGVVNVDFAHELTDRPKDKPI